MQFKQDGLCLFSSAILQNTLYHSAAIRMCGQIIYLPTESIYNELQVARINALHTLLDHMIPILIFNTLQNIAIQFLDNTNLQ